MAQNENGHDSIENSSEENAETTSKNNSENEIAIENVEENKDEPKEKNGSGVAENENSNDGSSSENESQKDDEDKTEIEKDDENVESDKEEDNEGDDNESEGKENSDSPTKEKEDEGSQNEENEDDDFDPSLLCPDISMDVEEAPVVTTAGERESDGLDSNSLFTPLFSTFVDEMTGAEISFDLTPEEQRIREEMYGPDNPIEFSRIHCTACNVHLGSALAGQTNRFVHPLLKVLICKECYNFYASGEFEKDEDGSELYCRWCGQGGQVLCCTKCEFVFCKKCIRINFGRKKLIEVRDSDEWMCFRCDIGQLKVQRAMCVEFFEYVKRETARAAALGDGNYMNQDLATCCNPHAKKRNPDGTLDDEVKRPKKRKRVEDPDYSPWNDTPSKLEKVEEDEPKPGPSGVNSTTQRVMPPLYPKPVLNNVITVPGPCITPTIKIGNTVLNVTSSKTAPILSNTAIRIRPQSNIATPINIRPKMIGQNNRPQQIINRNNFTVGSPAQFTVLTPANARMMNPIRLVPTSTVTLNNATTTTAVTANTKTTLKHEWFEKTVRSAARVNSNLSYTLTQLNKAQSNAASVEQLAVVHNKLQEILSSSINSLIQIRKNLRTEFIAGIKTIKFPSKKRSNVAKDDDVVIVGASSLKNVPKLVTNKIQKTTTTPTFTTRTLTPTTNKGYLKVRSFSQLQSVPSECITIPDDEPVKENDKIESVKEKSAENQDKDPLQGEKKEDETTKKKSENEDKDGETTDKDKENENNDEERNKTEEKKTNGTSELEEVKIKEEPSDETNSYNVKEKPSPKVRRMLSVKVNLKKTPIVEKLVKDEPIENGDG